MSTEGDAPTAEISRRDALKRGFRLTGAVLWATPVLQVVNMTKAQAQVTSGPSGGSTTTTDPSDPLIVDPTDPPVVDPVVVTKVCYAVKVDTSSRRSYCVDISRRHRLRRHGHWMNAGEFDRSPGSGGCGLISSKETSKTGAWKVVLREGVDAIDVTGFSNLKFSRGGRNRASLTYDRGTRTLTFTPPRRRRIVSVRFYFCVVVPG